MNFPERNNLDHGLAMTKLQNAVATMSVSYYTETDRPTENRRTNNTNNTNHRTNRNKPKRNVNETNARSNHGTEGKVWDQHVDGQELGARPKRMDAPVVCYNEWEGE